MVHERHVPRVGRRVRCLEHVNTLFPERFDAAEGCFSFWAQELRVHTYPAMNGRFKLSRRQFTSSLQLLYVTDDAAILHPR